MSSNCVSDVDTTDSSSILPTNPVKKTIRKSWVDYSDSDDSDSSEEVAVDEENASPVSTASIAHVPLHVNESQGSETGYMTFFLFSYNLLLLTHLMSLQQHFLFVFILFIYFRLFI